MRRACDLDLDGFAPIAPGQPIQAKRAQHTRALRAGESLSLTLGALGTLGRTRGVRIANRVWRGRQTAVVLIEDARFGADDKGITTLADVLEGSVMKEYA